MLALHGLGFDVCAPVVRRARAAAAAFAAGRRAARPRAARSATSSPADGDWLEPDVVLAPLLAFDAEGWRLGYGGGYYDRTLAELRARREITALGFAFAGQQVAAVAHGPGDARLDGVVTEAGLLLRAA